MKRFLKNERGNTTVEFAIILPILLFGTLLVFDLGRLLLAQSSIQESASETARMAAINPTSADSDIINYSRSLVAAIDRDALIVDIKWQTGRSRGGNVTITLTSEFELYSVQLFALVPVQLSATASLTIL